MSKPRESRRRTTPREEEYDGVCPRCKAHLYLHVSMTAIATMYIKKIVVVRNPKWKHMVQPQETKNVHQENSLS